MRFKAIVCQVFTREIESVLSRSPHSVELETLPMGLHDLGAAMRPHLQQRIDAADDGGYDAILLGYALCGRGTEGLRARNTPLVLPRMHDCIGLLMGGRSRYQTYFESHPGVYFRSPGWIEFQKPGEMLQPAWASASNGIGERRTCDELIAQYGEENGNYLFEQFRTLRRHYSGLTYISTGIASEDSFRQTARAEAQREAWVFEEVQGSLHLLERLVSGEWDPADFLVVPPGATVHGTLGESIVEVL